MVQLSFFDEVKDKASRLLPTEYLPIVEQCTAPHLVIPTYENVVFLCDSANTKPDAVADIVRSVRRRITDDDVAVKHLTIQLLSALIKSGGSQLHVEVAERKGLLRDLVNVACMHPTSGRGMQAKEAALLLILNLSIWFVGHPDERCFILTTLAGDVRAVLGPNCFEGIEPDRSIHVRLTAGQRRRQQSEVPLQRREHRSGHGSEQRKKTVVNAIPVDMPTEQTIAVMLDTCMTFSEYLNNAERTPTGAIRRDDVIQTFIQKVKEDRDYVAVLLSSNLQLDRDLLHTVNESQTAVLTKVEVTDSQKAAPAATAQPPPSVAANSGTVRSAVDTENEPTASSPHVAHPHLTEEPGQPSIDDLFGQSGVESTAAVPSVAAPVMTSTETAPATSTTTETAVGSNSSPVATLLAAQASGNASAPAAPPSAVASEASPVATTAASPSDEKEEQEAQTPLPEAVAVSTENADQATSTSPLNTSGNASPQVAMVTAEPPVVSPKDDEDFEAFLEGRANN